MFTTCKRSLEQSNIFRGICNSVHGGLCMMSLPVWLPRPTFFYGRGSLSLVPCFFWGFSVQGVSVQGVFSRGVSVWGSLSMGGSLSRGQSLSKRVLGNRLHLYLFCICFLKSSCYLCIVFIKNG